MKRAIIVQKYLRSMFSKERACRKINGRLQLRRNVEPGCTNGISIFDYEKVLDKLMQTIIEDDAEDIICNYTGRMFKTGKLKFSVEKQDGDVFWVSIPERR